MARAKKKSDLEVMQGRIADMAKDTLTMLLKTAKYLEQLVSATKPKKARPAAAKHRARKSRKAKAA